MENHHVSWENQLCLWPCSIAMLVITSGYISMNSGQLSSNFLVRSCMWSSQSVWIPKTTTTRAVPRRRPRTGIYPHSTLVVASGKRLHNYGKSQSLIGKSTINGQFSIAMLVITIGYSNCLYFRVLKSPIDGRSAVFFSRIVSSCFFYFMYIAGHMHFYHHSGGLKNASDFSKVPPLFLVSWSLYSLCFPPALN